MTRLTDGRLYHQCGAAGLGCHLQKICSRFAADRRQPWSHQKLPMVIEKGRAAGPVVWINWVLKTDCARGTQDVGSTAIDPATGPF